MEQINHVSHGHPLVMFIDQEQSNRGKEVYCSGCREEVLSPRFSCVECQFHLHKKCAYAPLKIENHLLHGKHPISFRPNPPSNRPYNCDLCKEKRKMFVYYCFYCDFSLDINCALSSLDIRKSPHESKNNVHRHPLTFIENHKDELKRAYCSWCHEPLEDSIYICLRCKFYLHKKCFDLPTKINHPCHLEHPLILDSRNDYLSCKLCQTEHWGLFYQCSHCEFGIHVECVWPKPVVDDRSHHEHLYTLLLKRSLFICDACGLEGNYVSYTCATCHLQVHEKCTSLPHIIKIARHDHPIFLHHSLQNKDLEKEDCKICFEKVKRKHGSYYCLNRECNYIVHVNCATDDDNLYYVIDQENQDEELISESLALLQGKSIDSSIIIEVDYLGDAIKIKHFIHEHELRLGDKIEGENKCCDGCMLSISTSFYYCSQCNFHLHKSCAELPRKKHHWFQRFLIPLKSKDIFRCFLCNHLCSGFFYESEIDYDIFHFCLRCVTNSDTLKCEGHKHFLFFDHRCKRKCNACGVGSRYGAYRCKDCNFSLDFACITLLQIAHHKCDEHPLKLTYQDGAPDDPEQHYCEICEEKRDPTHWFYHCAICDNSVHPQCALGKYPFIKIGSTCTYEDHPHRLTFVQKSYEHPGRHCIFCGKPCHDLALECLQYECNYIAHWECMWFRL